MTWAGAIALHGVLFVAAAAVLGIYSGAPGRRYQQHRRAQIGAWLAFTVALVAFSVSIWLRLATN